MIALAELLDKLKGPTPSFIVESESTINVLDLTATDARKILDASKLAGLDATAYDGENQQWASNELEESWAPYRVLISKPRPTDRELFVITNIGFAAFLKVGSDKLIWNVARLRGEIVTQGRLIRPWNSSSNFSLGPATKGPRQFVREYGVDRKVPEDIRPWLLINTKNLRAETAAFEIWANHSIVALLHALPDEIDMHSGKLKFRGPPRVNLLPPSMEENLIDVVGTHAFCELQDAAAWVFENEREVEMRHGFLSNEIARSIGVSTTATEFIKGHIAASLESARVAYQMSISDLSRDTLKALSDLRRSVTEEIAKVNDATRQLITSVTGAVAIGIGLIFARFTMSIDLNLLRGVMVVVVICIFTISYSGFQFIALQRRLRTEWQPKLYRFLSNKEFDSMVVRPTKAAEGTFKVISIASCLAVLGLAIVIFCTNSPNAAVHPSTPNSPERTSHN